MTVGWYKKETGTFIRAEAGYKKPPRAQKCSRAKAEQLHETCNANPIYVPRIGYSIVPPNKYPRRNPVESRRKTVLIHYRGAKTQYKGLRFTWGKTKKARGARAEFRSGSGGHDRKT